MTLEQLLHIIIKRLPMILIFIIVATSIAGIISWCFMADIYKASATVIVSNTQKSNNSMTYSDYSLNIELANSYRVLCKTDRILNQVIKELNLQRTTKQLRDEITVSSEENTEIILLDVKDPDPVLAQKIANTLASVFEREVAAIMKMDNVQIVDFAQLPAVPVEPNRIQNLLLGAFSGAVLGIGIVLLLEYLNRSVKTEDEVSEILGAPVLGVVPHINIISHLEARNEKP